VSELHRAESERRRDEEAEVRLAITKLPRFHLRENVSRADEELAADAPAPFWRHVRDALAERDP
jgi:hypothetical protein